MGFGKCWLYMVVVGLSIGSTPVTRGAALDQSSFSYAQDGWSPQIGSIGADKGAPFPNGVGYAAQAQTFTAGISGRLDSVGVHLQSFIPDVTEPLLMAIRSTTGGVPASDASGDLGVATVTDTFHEVSLPGINWGDVRRVDFSHLNIAVSAGAIYAIVLYSEAVVPESGSFSGYGFPYGWDGARTLQQYVGGRAFGAIEASGTGPFSWQEGAPDHDHFFQTFVSPDPIPEPSTGLLLIVGLAGLFGIPRVWRQRLHVHAQ